MTEASQPVPDQAALSRLTRTRRSGRLAHLPLWQGIEAADVESGTLALLADCETRFRALEEDHEPTWSGLMDPLEWIEQDLGAVLGPVGHLLSVKYSDALQGAYDAVRPAVIALSNAMSQSTAVYAGLKALRDSAEGRSLDTTRARILSESLRGMERAGVHLTGAARDRHQAINEELAQLSNDFQTNLVKEEGTSNLAVTDAAELAGLPEAVVQQARQKTEAAGADAQAWHFVVNGPNYMAVIQHGQHRGLRERFYRAFRSRGTSAEFDNREILQNILRLRQEKAQLVGFDHYAALSIDSKMAESTDAVWALLGELEQAARPAAEREYAELRAFMTANGAEGADAPEPWDVGFWAERLQEDRYAYDAEALREYFQLPRVLDGLFELVQTLYGVEITETADAELPRWDDDVQFFEVRQAGKVIAGFYVDPYARPGEKRGGAWMNTVVDRARTLAMDGESASLPVALFVMNARPPADGRPGLMSLDEVRTLFHEFGHATQHMFTEIDEGGASGMSLVEWDSVELASQFNEFWMEHPPFLARMTAHVDTGETLAADIIDRIQASKNFMIGNGTLRQLQFAKTDMALHERFGIDDSVDSPFALESEIAAATVVTPMLTGESQLPAFGHLFAGGYAAGYYSYKWAEVLAADAFAAFREVGLDNTDAVREVAHRFKATVLALGGSQPAAEIYRAFRGRDATPQALLADQGLIESAA
ncbi:MAG: M3 family metallopeptidase [Pseudomonadota bacterium]